MAKRRENFRVVAYIDERYRYGLAPESLEKHRAGEATDLLAQVKRHCDANSAEVEWDVVCSHCGRIWEEEASGEPVCCGNAQDEWAQAAGAAQITAK